MDKIKDTIIEQHELDNEPTPPVAICGKCGKGINTLNVANWKGDSYYHFRCLPTTDINPEQHAIGTKLDKGKNQLGLVLGDFSEALWQVGLVGTQGAIKYTPHGWIRVPDGISRYTDAMLRHHLKENMGELLDPELTEMAGENIYHAACVAWNALARLKLILQEKENDSI